MVMAAGFGKRMQDLTTNCPKPLIPVGGRTMLDRVLDQLGQAGVSRAVVNVHYLAHMVEDCLRARHCDLEILISDERDRLRETGGGLLKAMSLLDREYFFVLNSDMIWCDGVDDTLCTMARLWRPDDMDALLLVVPTPDAKGHGGTGDFHMDETGRLSRCAPRCSAPFVYTGIQIASRSLLRDPPDDPSFSLNIPWDRALNTGRLYGAVHDGLWFDVGTPKALEDARTHFEKD